jgi:hypothetical protein
MSVTLINPTPDVVTNCAGTFVKQEQFIPQSFLDDIRDEREASLNTPAGELYRVARIPAAVIDKWDREGFDYNNAPVQDILRKLQIDQLDAFITTNKRVRT